MPIRDVALSVLALAVIACSGDTPTAQDLELIAQPLTTVEAAEAEGAKYSRAKPPMFTRRAFRDSSTPGTAERKCVAADTSVIVRSGEIVARGLKQVAGFPVYSWWSMQHQSWGEGPPMTIRAARLDSAGEASTRTFQGREGVPWNRLLAAQPRMGPTGRWLLVATAGRDWGCFIAVRNPRLDATH